MFAILLCVLCACGLLCACGPDTGKSSPLHSDDVADYDRSLVIEKYGGDLNSDLSVFPDEVLTESATYTVDLRSNLFDTDGEMILDCTYDREQFEAEVSRLAKLSKTIRGDAEEYTNTVLYDEESYRYPAYVTIDGFGDTYEYALIDEANGRIVYVYLAYPDSDTLDRHGDLVKRDRSVYDEEETGEDFSMYNHSFDGGESFIEFDD